MDDVSSTLSDVWAYALRRMAESLGVERLDEVLPGPRDQHLDSL